MHTKLVPDRPLTIVVAALAAGSLLFGQEEETSTTRLLKSSEADQIAYLNDYIAEGMTTPTDDAQILVLNKPSLFAPMLEQSVQQPQQSHSKWILNQRESEAFWGLSTRLTETDLTCMFKKPEERMPLREQF
jgi:hypothetical protein